MEAVAAQAATFSKLGLTNQVVLVNGNIGVVSRLPNGRVLVPSFLLDPDVDHLTTAGMSD
jgi:hypothetical protein